MSSLLNFLTVLLLCSLLFRSIVLQHFEACSKLQQALGIDADTGGRMLWKNWTPLFIYNHTFLYYCCRRTDIFPHTSWGTSLSYRTWKRWLWLAWLSERKLNGVFLPVAVQPRAPFVWMVRIRKRWFDSQSITFVHSWQKLKPSNLPEMHPNQCDWFHPWHTSHLSLKPVLENNTFTQQKFSSQRISLNWNLKIPLTEKIR